MTEQPKLTARQAEILELIRQYIREYGMPPTRAEIAAELGFRSANAAEDHLRALAKKGAIELLSGTSRGIQLPADDPVLNENRLPIVGRVAAGQPILAEQHIEDYYDQLGTVFRPKADYLLRVSGLSMRDIGIMDGDLLAVHRTPEAQQGQIVVARVEDEVTVKRFRRRGNNVQLLPENPDFNPINVDLREQAFAIEGIAVGLLRGEM